MKDLIYFFLLLPGSFELCCEKIYIEGTVIDSQTGAPLDSAMILYSVDYGDSVFQYTDSAGRFNCYRIINKPSLFPISYTEPQVPLLAKKKGYKDFRRYCSSYDRGKPVTIRLKRKKE